MTLSELRNEIKTLCGDLTNNKYQDPHLTRLINIAKDEFCEDTLILRSYREITTTADTERYELASDVIAVYRVEFDSDGNTGSDFSGTVIGRVRSPMLEHVTEV